MKNLLLKFLHHNFFFNECTCFASYYGGSSSATTPSLDFLTLTLTTTYIFSCQDAEKYQFYILKNRIDIELKFMQ